MLRKVRANFISNWRQKPPDLRVSDKEFQDMFSDIRNERLSSFKGDGSKSFTIDIVAALALNGGFVKSSQVITFRTTTGCIMFVSDPNNDRDGTGVPEVDDAHWRGFGDISEMDLVGILESMNDSDVYNISRDEIFDAIVKFVKRYPHLKEKAKNMSPSAVTEIDRRLN